MFYLTSLMNKYGLLKVRGEDLQTPHQLLYPSDNPYPMKNAKKNRNLNISMTMVKCLPTNPKGTPETKMWMRIWILCTQLQPNLQSLIFSKKSTLGPGKRCPWSIDHVQTTLIYLRLHVSHILCCSIDCCLERVFQKTWVFICWRFASA